MFTADGLLCASQVVNFPQMSVLVACEMSVPFPDLGMAGIKVDPVCFDQEDASDINVMGPPISPGLDSMIMDLAQMELC
ncbi:hypothetical protein NPIL_582421 [Nephila pilipes]|uniref:Uncharacterized protein n=1 Tax=Nephila pilipes TaxID=299642 RepID=A0A8X6PR58_NEPPI|nr:hypothetical protein NPIL_582421 [Nephila pilipes]